jgi:hypothetical protein
MARQTLKAAALIGTLFRTEGSGPQHNPTLFLRDEERRGNVVAATRLRGGEEEKVK